MPWIRIINPEAEFRTLSIRERLTDEQLAAQQFRYPKSNEHAARINFTPASAFQYFTNGVRQHFFERDESAFGLVINRTEANRNVMFRDSMRCEVSDSVFKSPLTEQEFETQLRDNRFVRTTERDASKMVKKQWRKLSEDHEKYRKDCAEYDMSDPGETSLPWTEGIFRHKFSDIDSIFIKQNVDSIRNGYAFAKVLEGVTDKRFTFHAWSEEGAELVELDRGKIKEFLGFTTDRSNPSKQNIDRETRSKIAEFQSYFEGAQKGGR